MPTSRQTLHEAREAAIEETKIGGRPQIAIALAIVYLADVLRSRAT